MSSVVTKEDIIKEIHNETGIPIDELSEVVDINIDYIKNKVLTTDYVLIRLPNLCTIRFNYRLGKSSLAHSKKLNKTVKSEAKIKALTAKLNVLENVKLSTEEWRNFLNFSNPLYERLWKKDKMVKRVNYIFSNSNKIIKELEEKANEIIIKI